MTISEKPEFIKNYFPELTGVRAISAYFVFLHHYNHFNLGRSVDDFIGGLHIGVTIFFVLSGFLITYRYFDKGPLKFKKYFINRFARIYPMYFLLTSATFLVAAILMQQRGLHDLKIYLLNISFLRGFFNNLKFTGVAQGWSLTVEETFYFLAPVLFIFIKKNKYYLLIFPIIFVLIGLSMVYLSSKLKLGSFFETNYFMFGYTFFGRAFEFFIGISLAIFFKKFRDRFKTIWCTYTGLFIIFLCVFFLSLLKHTGNYQFGIEHPAGMVINNTLLPLFGISLFFWGLLTEKTFIRNFLSTKVMVLLGKSSYIFYLIHVGIFYQLITNYTSGLLVIFVLLNIISVLLFKLVEEPLNLFIRKKLYGDRP